jgi:nicotinate phosphoribosyltransferase
VYRTDSGRHVVRPVDGDRPSDGRPLLEPLLRDGDVVRSFSIDEAADRALGDARAVGFRGEG